MKQVAFITSHAYIKKEHGQWCVHSEKNPSWSGGCYDTKEKAEKRLQQVEMFKHKKADAVFIGFQKHGNHSIALYNVTKPGHPLYLSTVTAETLRRHHLRVPATLPDDVDADNREFLSEVWAGDDKFKINPDSSVFYTLRGMKGDKYVIVDQKGREKVVPYNVRVFNIEPARVAHALPARMMAIDVGKVSMSGQFKKASDLTELTDVELQAKRDALPKYKNNMTPEQLAENDAVYQEQMRRYKAVVADYNARAEEVTGLKPGDRVSYVAPNIFGIGTETYAGTVIFDRTGRLAVKLDHAEGSGRKVVRIHKGFKQIEGGMELSHAETLRNHHQKVPTSFVQTTLESQVPGTVDIAPVKRTMTNEDGLKKVIYQYRGQIRVALNHGDFVEAERLRKEMNALRGKSAQIFDTVALIDEGVPTLEIAHEDSH